MYDNIINDFKHYPLIYSNCLKVYHIKLLDDGNYIAIIDFLDNTSIKITCNPPKSIRNCLGFFSCILHKNTLCLILKTGEQLTLLI